MPAHFLFTPSAPPPVFSYAMLQNYLCRMDWTGNANSIYKTHGASNHCAHERECNDFYATDPVAVDMLLSKVELPPQVLEPACGCGSLSEHLVAMGYNVKSYDLVDRGYGVVGDFFEMQSPPFPGDFAIVTNPPYKMAKEFVLHSLELVPDGSLVCMFLKTTFAEGKGRYRDLFCNYPPLKVLQCVERVLCAKNADFELQRKQGSAVAYAWWVWKKGHQGPTILDWI